MGPLLEDDGIVREFRAEEAVNQRDQRILRLDAMLRDHDHIVAKVVCSRLGADERTIRRDLQHLSHLGGTVTLEPLPTRLVLRVRPTAAAPPTSPRLPRHQHGSFRAPAVAGRH